MVEHLKTAAAWCAIILAVGGLVALSLVVLSHVGPSAAPTIEAAPQTTTLDIVQALAANQARVVDRLEAQDRALRGLLDGLGLRECGCEERP